MFRPAILFIAALAAITALGGCANSMGPKKPQLSLMERYHSGMDLMADEEPATDEDKRSAARAHLMRGLNFQDLGRTELAFEQFSRAAALDPELAEARYRRGLTLMDRGMPDQALAEFAAVQERMPDYAPAHEAAGLVYFENGLYDEAERHLGRALELDPTLVGAHEHLGVIRNYRADHEGALKAFQAALALNPADGAVHNNIGMTLSMLGRDEEAVEAFGTALRLGAPTGRAYNNMGLALARLGRWREALEAFRCAGGEAAAYNNLGYLYFLDEDYAKAVAAFERAIELEPSYYVRAGENLKRARLALRFAEAGRPGAVPAAAIPELDAPSGLPAGPLRLAGGAPGPALNAAPQTAAPGPVAQVPQATEPRAAMRLASATVAAPVQSAGLAGAVAAPAQASLAAGLAAPAVATDASTAQAAPTMVAQTSRVAERFRPPGPLPNYPVYTLHQSSWQTLGRAQQVAGRLRSKGFEAYVLHVRLPGKGDWYRVTIGMFHELADARARMAELDGVDGMEDLRVVRRQRHEYPGS